MFEAIKNIKTMDDIRVEKARLRYEALLAEKNLNDSIHAFEKMSMFFSSLKRAFSVFQQSYHLFLRMTSFFGRIFSGFRRKEKEPEEQPGNEEKVVY